MSNWIAITKATLYEASVAKLIDAVDSKALAAGQPNRSAGIIQGVVDHVRRKIASHQRNQLDADITTIPKGLRDLAVDLVIARLKTALQMELNPDERENIARRERDLNRVAEGRDVVDQPDTAVVAPMEPLVPPPSFGPKPARANNELSGSVTIKMIFYVGLIVLGLILGFSDFKIWKMQHPQAPAWTYFLTE